MDNENRDLQQADFDDDGALEEFDEEGFEQEMELLALRVRAARFAGA